MIYYKCILLKANCLASNNSFLSLLVLPNAVLHVGIPVLENTSSYDMSLWTCVDSANSMFSNGF